MLPYQLSSEGTGNRSVFLLMMAALDEDFG